MMVVETTVGSKVSFERTDGISLFDRDGIEWARSPEEDVHNPYGCAYRETKNNIACVRLTMPEIQRVIKGNNAMQTPTTVEEMRYYALHLHKDCQMLIDEWPDQRLREILMEAEDKGRHPGHLLEDKVVTMLQPPKKDIDAEHADGRLPEASSVPPERPKTNRTYKSTPRKKKTEEGLSVAFGEMTVTLTSKQLEFMERLSECPGWDKYGVSGEYVASQYAEELSDTMNPMSVGAVLTTLREKGLITTEKTRIGGIKCCLFTLTSMGQAVYNKLAGVEEDNE